MKPASFRIKSNKLERDIQDEDKWMSLKYKIKIEGFIMPLLSFIRYIILFLH